MTIELDAGEIAEIEPSPFALLNAEGRELASAKNFPVNLAYATTIHKAQGMTLDKVLVDLSRLWEPGQAYVAMSRVRTKNALYVAAWNASSIRTDPRVLAFNRDLLEN